MIGRTEASSRAGITAAGCMVLTAEEIGKQVGFVQCRVYERSAETI